MNKFKKGNTVWTFSSTIPAVIGPLEVREVDDSGLLYVCSNKETTIRMPESEFSSAREQAAIKCKQYHSSKILGMKLHLESYSKMVDKFLEEEGI